MFKKKDSRFLYHAHAVALAGSFTKPHREHMEALAGSVLPITGGLAAARVNGFKHRELISCRAAYTQCTGVEGEHGDHTTLMTATVEGLNVMDVLTADKVVARLASHHYMDEKKEPTFLATGSHIENLRIGGHLVNLDHDEDVCSKWHGYSDAVRGHAKRKIKPQNLGIIATSMYKGATQPPGMKAIRHRIEFPEFGVIYLGEYYISGAQRRLTMMRIVLGCVNDGDVSAGEVTGNGTPIKTEP